MTRLLFLSLLIAGTVEAKEFRWLPPATYTDGSAIAAHGHIGGYNLYCDGVTTPRHVFQGAGVKDTAGAVSGTVAFPPGSSHSCYLTAFMDAAHGSVESEPSNSIEFIEAFLKPQPPVLQ